MVTVSQPITYVTISNGVRWRSRLSKDTYVRLSVFLCFVRSSFPQFLSVDLRSYFGKKPHLEEYERVVVVVVWEGRQEGLPRPAIKFLQIERSSLYVPTVVS